jgi:hypothetical protein
MRVVPRLFSSTLTMTLLAAGLGVIHAAPAGAASGSASCFPAKDTILGAGNFTDQTAGTGVGDVAFEPSGAPSTEGTGRLTWSERQAVTGNTEGQTGNMTGALTFSLSLGGQSVSFTSSCILEAGVFAGETEDDPFGPETNRTVIRGIEGEFIGTAQNFPSRGVASQVVGSLAIWTTSAGPRYHLDMQTATFTPGQCPNESGESVSSASAAGTTPDNQMVLNAPNQRSGRGSCFGD